jgi:hypothetical protein
VCGDAEDPPDLQKHRGRASYVFFFGFLSFLKPLRAMGQKTRQNASFAFCLPQIRFFLCPSAEMKFTDYILLNEVKRRVTALSAPFASTIK